MKGQETREKILEATYQALAKHGYADLTIEKIAEEFEKGKSVIYYHFEDKEELMLDFLDYLTEAIRRDITGFDGEPDERLENFLEMSLAVDDEEMWEFRTAILEMRAQSPYSPEFARKFEQIDVLLHGYLKKIFEEKESEDPEKAARLVLSAVEGSMNRAISIQDRSDLEKVGSWIRERF